MLTVSTYLTQLERSTEDFFTICSNLEMKGKLGPDNLTLLKKAFPPDRDKEAFEKIAETETNIKLLSSGNCS